MSNGRWFVAAVVTLLLTACADVVQFTNVGGAGSGVLVDGRDGTTDFSDRAFTTAGASVGVGSVALGTTTNELVGFTQDRPPRWVAAPWTSGDDTLTVDFRPEIAIPVTVWIVKGPFADQRQHAIEACIRTSAIWHAERVGVRFSPFEIRDATADPQAAARFAFPNGDNNPAAWQGLRDDIGFVNGRLNIYWVETVNGATTSGWSNFGSQIAMGEDTGDELLSHEIGHAFSLLHVNGDPDFNTENVMHNASSTRQFLTEGQLFRAHLDPDSVLNALYSARPGELTRQCGHAENSPTCPALRRRLWADGVFPAN